jgi:tRNA(fMet)-specific endonuclease VapC
MRYLLDTNIIVLYLREGVLADFIDDTFNPLDDANEAILCVVSKGELKSLAKKNDWRIKKLAKLESLCEELLITDINSEDIIERYAEIDAFSQGRLKNKPSSFSARNMGKNDLWIATTASIIGATLLTTDRDFDHLHNVFLDIEYIKMK